MKAIKLILSFVLILGVIVGALYLTGAIGVEEEVIPSDPETFNDQRELLDKEWKNAQWDINLYDRGTARLAQYKDKLNEDDMKTLVDQLNEYAIPKLYSAMMKEFANPNCDDKTIQSLSKDLTKLKSNAPGRENKDSMLITMTGTYKVYQDAISLCSKSISFNPGNGVTWTPLETQKNSFRNIRNNIRGNKYFGNIKNITRISNGLNNLETKMNVAAKGFGDRVADRIIKAFNRGKNGFWEVENRFRREFPSNTSLNELAQRYR